MSRKTKGTGAKTRSGKFDREEWEKKAEQDLSSLPVNIQRLMLEENPDWDWTDVGDYIVIRLYDEGVEFERVAAIVSKRRTFN